MKELTVKFSENVFNDLKHELSILQMMKPDGLSFMEEALVKMFQEWSKGEVPELVYKTEKETQDV